LDLIGWFADTLGRNFSAADAGRWRRLRNAEAVLQSRSVHALLIAAKARAPGRDGAKRNPHEESRIMAKIEQLAVLRQGVGIWNAWRGENPSIRPDLAEMNLSGINLSEALLTDAILSKTNLSRANLSRAFLTGADLEGANLSGANFSGGTLSAQS
jgi:uncharacterized protein YjbI with pentapeptide repeats